MSTTPVTPTVPTPKLDLSKDFRDLLHEINPELSLEQLRENKDIVLNAKEPSSKRSYCGHLWSYITEYVTETPTRTKIMQAGSLLFLGIGYAAEQIALGYNSFGTQCQVNELKQCVPGSSPIPGFVTGITAGTLYFIVNGLNNHLNIGSAYSTNKELKEQQNDAKLKMLHLRYLEHLDRWVTEKNKEQAVLAAKVFQEQKEKDLNAEKLAKYVSFIIKHAPDDFKKELEQGSTNKTTQDKKEVIPEIVPKKEDSNLIGVKEEKPQPKLPEEPIVKKEVTPPPTDNTKVPELSPETKPETVPLKKLPSKDLLIPKEQVEKPILIETQETNPKEVKPTNILDDIKERVLPVVSQIKQDLKALVQEIKNPTEVKTTEGTDNPQKPKMDWKVEGSRKSQILPPKQELIIKVDKMFSAIRDFLELPGKPIFLEMDGIRVHHDYSISRTKSD